MLAVIETGGKEYLVSPNQKIKIEKIKNLKQGDKIEFEKVLLISDEKEETLIGKPYLEGKKVIGEVLKTGKGKKVIVFKYHSKTRYRKKKGHRQPYLEVLIKEIQ
ncbi:MAG TPA: 50S ribosomal protein L21 [Candidatus Paceibacterota bacterium]|nr:50S ribosomal protein L21 [Candidatus Paceibacterota bacterium]HOK97379.1 50S ribosomal protein L21 [Candidatus Paceibacterota bacterium]HPP64856.1 50S ribosomal protein L21 [Candidatus Paceibacterota bacterium]